MKWTPVILCIAVGALMGGLLLRPSSSIEDQNPAPRAETAAMTRETGNIDSPSAPSAPPQSLVGQRDPGADSGPRKLRDEPDYGQFILQAISNQSARDAKEAADYLSRCSVAKKLHEALEKSRGGTQLSNAKLGKLIDGAEDLQRKCQSVSEDMAAHGEELALRALQGGIPGAGVAYGERVNYSPPEAMKVPLREALRLDAMAGSEVAVQRLALYGNKLGLTSYEQTAYYAVAMELGSQHQAEMLQRVVEARNPPALSAQEKVEADRIAQRLRAKLAAKPRGMSDS